MAKKFGADTGRILKGNAEADKLATKARETFPRMWHDESREDARPFLRARCERNPDSQLERILERQTEEKNERYTEKRKVQESPRMEE